MDSLDFLSPVNRDNFTFSDHQTYLPHDIIRYFIFCNYSILLCSKIYRIFFFLAEINLQNNVECKGESKYPCLFLLSGEKQLFFF